MIFIIIFFFNFRSDSNAPASVQIEATEESEQGFDGMIYFYLFLLLDLIQLPYFFQLNPHSNRTLIPI